MMDLYTKYGNETWSQIVYKMNNSLLLVFFVFVNWHKYSICSIKANLPPSAFSNQVHNYVYTESALIDCFYDTIWAAWRKDKCLLYTTSKKPGRIPDVGYLRKSPCHHHYDKLVTDWLKEDTYVTNWKILLCIFFPVIVFLMIHVMLF